MTGNGFGSADADEIRIVAIAASLGGIEALTRIVQELPADFPAPIVAVQHLAPYHRSNLDRIIQARCAVHVKLASDGERLERGAVYLAPPNQHMTVTAGGAIALTISERVNWVRPAADVLFASVASEFGNHALAVVLSGCLHDGAKGAVCIKRAGGWVLAQDEQSCRCFEMPHSAIRTGAVDFVLSLETLPFAILSLVMAFGATSLFRVPCRLETAAA